MKARRQISMNGGGLSVSLRRAGLAVAALVSVACGDLTGPVSPSTPINVTATLVSPTSARIDWAPSPQSDGVISYNVFRNGDKVGETETTTFTDTGLAQQTTYSYTVSANCTSGVLSEQSAETAAATVLTVDVTAPRVTAAVPVNGATNVSLVATAAITFSEPMDPATITTANVNIRITSTGQIIPGTVVYTAATRVAEYKPTASLPNATNFTVTVTAGAKDLSGNALSPVFTSTFTTRDEVGPAIASTTPANGAAGVPTNTPITVTFSEPVDPTTINATSFTLRLTTSGAAVPGTVSYNTTTRVATFAPGSPLTQNTGYTATVAGTVRDLAGNQMGANFQFAFSTGDNIPPTILSTVPVDLAAGVPTSVIVSATFSEPMDPTTINGTTFTLRLFGSSTPIAGTVAYNSATNTATFTPASPLAGSTTYTATVTTGAKDVAGNALVANRSWTFITADATPPTVTSVSPPNNATAVPVSTTVSVTFSEAMDATTINTTTVTLRNTLTSAPVTGTVAYNAVTFVATFTPSAPLAHATNYTVTVTTGAKDAGGNALATSFLSGFTTAIAPDVTAPTVLSTVPANGATNVATNTTVTVNFSEAMDVATINSTNLRLTATIGGAVVPAVVTLNPAGTAAIITPTAPLANITNYTVTVTTAVRDVAGNALASQFTGNFTTIADTTSPTVTPLSPAANATNVPVGTTVTVTFSENMDATTINTTTFNLRTTIGGVLVAGAVVYNTTTRVATFTPTAPLAAGTSYTATVTTGAKDVAGNGLTGHFTFSFTTAP